MECWVDSSSLREEGGVEGWVDSSRDVLRNVSMEIEGQLKGVERERRNTTSFTLALSPSTRVRY